MLTHSTRIAVVGNGRLGRAMAAALAEAGFPVAGPLGRGASGADAEVVLLCVPDGAIADAARCVAEGRLVGHCSGATTLAPHEGFSLHPLMTVSERTTRFAGAGCAVAGTTERARTVATELGLALGMRPFAVADADRPLYHAAASVASNYVVTLAGIAEQLAARAGVPRELLAPLAEAAIDQWRRRGAREALTGPIVRGDVETVRRQREAVAAQAPDALAAWDALAERTGVLARTGSALEERPR